MQRMGSVIASRYRVQKELGRGGMGVVYLVEHLHTGEHLALKALMSQAGADSVAIERLRREARASSQIKSEHVVKVLDADVAPDLGGAPFLVMELLNGCDLEKLLAARGPIPPAEVVDYLAQVARALDRAHALGIVHRDLKPENLFLHQRDDGSKLIKILDFGIAKVMAGGAADVTGGKLTSTGAVMGTPLYMTPEQGSGDAALTGPTMDIWALGLIAYRLLAGSHYWTSNTLPKLMVEIMIQPMPPPTSRAPQLPPAFDAWFARSCHRDPSQRFRTAGEQAAVLAAALGVPLSAPVSAPPASQPGPSAHALGFGPTLASPPQASSVGAGTPVAAAGVLQTPAGRVEPKLLWLKIAAAVAVLAALIAGAAGVVAVAVWQLGDQPSGADSGTPRPTVAAAPESTVPLPATTSTVTPRPPTATVSNRRTPPVSTAISPPPPHTTVTPPPQQTTVTPPPQQTTVTPPPQQTTVTPPPQQTTATPPPQQTTTLVPPPPKTPPKR